jgi:SNF2 family DNA or RNA helicase
MLIEAVGDEVSAVNAAAQLNKLLQISCGAVYTDTKNVIEFDASSRLNILLEVIEEASHKVLVFIPFTHALNLVQDFLTKNKVTSEIINGSVSVSKRTDIFKRFQESDEPRVLLIQPQAAAHGVTLHAANVIVWWGPITSIETYLQANARVHRAGQRNPVTVVHLQGSPVEKRIYKMLDEKIDVHSRMIDLYSTVLDEG